MAASDRWPPVYDAAGLKKIIRGFVDRRDGMQMFESGVGTGGALCQGDVLSLPAEIPVLDEEGAPVTFGEATHWLTVGNTCDFHRANVVWAQIVPVESPSAEHRGDVLTAIQKYETARNFYIPPWPGAPADQVFIANLLRPVHLHKSAIGPHATVVARMSREGWVLLHSCLVRFLARDDGRHDTNADEG